MQRFLLLVTFLALCSPAIWGNFQKVKVVSSVEEESVRFAYIYINGKPFGSSDKSGETYIPTAILKEGDIISASHVGYDGGFAIYEDQRKDPYNIYMRRTSIQTVKIYSRQEVRKQFRRINHLAPMARASDFTFQFIMDVNGEEYCRGDFYHYFNLSSFEDVVRGQGMDFGFESTLDFFGEEDTTKTAASDLATTPLMLNIHNRMYVEVPKELEPMVKNRAKADTIRKKIIPVLQNIFYLASRNVVTDPLFVELGGVQIRKVGDFDNKHQFILTREGVGARFDKVVSSVTTINVDTMMYEIKDARMNISRQDGRIELKAIYNKYGYFRYPQVIEATFYMNDGTTYAMAIYNVRPIYSEYKRFKKVNSLNIWDMDNDLADSESMTPLNNGGYHSPSGDYGIRLWNEFSKTIFSYLITDIKSGIKVPDMLIREKLEMIALANSVQQ